MGAVVEKKLASSDDKPAAEPLVTDLRSFVSRRFAEVEVEGVGRMRLKSLTMREVEDLQTFDEADQDFALAAMAIVNESGHSEHTLDPEGLGYFADVDAQIFGQVMHKIREHCLPKTDLASTVKN